MVMKNLSVIVGRTLVAMTLVVATPAWGQDAPLTPAQTLFESGKKAVEEERWPDALKMFTEAYKLEPQPRTAAWLGRVQVASGDYAAGAANLELYLREEKQPPEKMKAKVMETLADAKKKIVTLQLTIEPSDAAVSVDKQPIDPKRVSWPIYVIPGGHTVEVQKSGFETYRVEETYKPGDAPTIHAALKPEIVDDGKKKPGGTLPPLAIAGFAVGGGLLVTSAITGIVANVANQNAADAARGTGCAPRSECKAIFDEQYPMSTTFSIVALATLGAGIGVGVGTLVYTLKASKPSDTANAPKTSLNILPTPGGIIVRGAW